MAESGKTCQIKDTRSLGGLSGGGKGYEIACSDNTGYILVSKADGALAQAVPCTSAAQVAGGCKLTDTTVAQTQEAATYTRLAKASGFNCDVAKYRYIGIDSKKNEVVEIACTNRPDGGLARFPSDNSPGRVVDCVRADQPCKLSDPSVLYGRYTAALAAKGKGSCKISNARYAGHYENGDDLIEVACSDGLPGWVIEVNNAGDTVDLKSCGQFASGGNKCVLPGNAK